MFRKINLFILALLLLIPMQQGVAQEVQLDLSESSTENLNLLLIYSNKDSLESLNVKKLRLLLNHFTDRVVVVSDFEVKQEQLKDVTHVFYYGEVERKIKESARKLLNNVTVPIISIGENIEQLKAFKHVKKTGIVNINGINEHPTNLSKHYLDYPIIINHIELIDEIRPLLYAYKGNHVFPLLMKEKNNYYFATRHINDILELYFADLLHDILPNNHASEHVAYLRLEDIHPYTDPEKLLAVGEYLNERHIPYLLSIIPVYVAGDTEGLVYFSDSPDLVNVLQYLQETGGTVVSHGYTHQYNDSETGVGFEFWDVEKGQFITTNERADEREKILSQEQFTNKKNYNTYVQDLKNKERHYLEERLTNSIHELIYYNLYPLAFEAQHYRISQQGYEIASHYFSTIFGQIQYSDETWEMMGAPPYVSSINRMTLLPETIGYVDSANKYSLAENKKKLTKTLIVRDSMIGGYYHPYLGVDYLQEFLDLYDHVPNLSWLDLKMTEQEVRTDKVMIRSDGTGEIKIENNVSWWNDAVRQNPMSLLEKILWGVTVLVFIFILLFLFITIYLRTQLKKRLFRERSKSG